MFVILCAKVIKAIAQNKPPTKPLVETLGRQARRQGGFEGVRSNPPFGFQKILYAPLN